MAQLERPDGPVFAAEVIGQKDVISGISISVAPGGKIYVFGNGWVEDRSAAKALGYWMTGIETAIKDVTLSLTNGKLFVPSMFGLGSKWKYIGESETDNFTYILKTRKEAEQMKVFCEQHGIASHEN